MNLYQLEIKRSMRRRMVWVLLAVALAGIAALAIIALVSSGDLDLAEMQRSGQTHPAVLTDWWISGNGDGILTVTALFLFMGGLIGGAGVVGGEWRSGSIATMLTWEPRRVRLLASRLAAITTCAFVVAVVLQLVFLLSLMPSVLVNGTRAGADGGYAIVVGAAIVRIAGLTALATLLGGCLASVWRSTAGAVIGVWVWLALVEAILRARKPGLSGYLLSDSIVRVVTWADFEGSPASRSPAGALTLLGLYGATMVAIAILVFRRSDVIAG